MTFLFLFFAGHTAAFCFRASSPPSSLLASRVLRLAITLAPLFWSTWVAVSRVEDYVGLVCTFLFRMLILSYQRHHKEDVIVGSIIGILSAAITYFIYWPNPFSIRSFTSGRTGTARALYASQSPTRNDDDYELARIEEELGPA
jgi:diacylglycerol diphosphate phosphatase / phosphatidate phosphatase